MFQDLEIARGRRPLFRPAVERLDERVLPSVQSYQVAFTDIYGAQAEVSISWDVDSPTCQAALSGYSNAASATSYFNTTANMLAGSLDADGTYNGTLFDNLNNQVDPLSDAVGSYQNAVTSLAVGTTLDYKPATTGVTIDPSVVDLPTAKCRAQKLVNDVKTAIYGNQAIEADLNDSNVINRAAKTVWYMNHIADNMRVIRNGMAELKLIKTAYPGVFR